MKKFWILLFLSSYFVSGQSEDKEKVWDTFESTRGLFNHSTEMLYKRQFEFIVAHKFGDIAGPGAVGRWFGLDDLADVRIAFEYGLSDKFNVGLGRSKGVGVIKQVADGYVKYRILQQDNQSPLSLTWVSSLAFSYAKASSNPTAENAFNNFLDRLIYTHQLMGSRKLNDHFSLQLSVGVNHRNFVLFEEVNTVGFIGVTARGRFNPLLGVLVEYNHILNKNASSENKDPLSLGLELLTGGHAFTFIISNARGVNENLFIPSTDDNWLKGQFRLGFSITRKFKV
ncbi:hypothetical protein DNU06_14735 [Putridiphycobacter roseus]|uniref:DUF5777 domain-containing protein n=1 Tax=Putridiphycobacter roseus TaxID=2219161 RepID=A0A2W1MXF4_9FLAO|nr:DUF5777 family beta-barrel protein [Putridiphycobacter roseus]PZE16054.1 hypothetical protein DNU06_14735 [Putridiphycobacter roseus]